MRIDYPLIETPPEGDKVGRKQRIRVKRYFRRRRPNWLQPVAVYGGVALLFLLMGAVFYQASQVAIAIPALLGLVIFGSSSWFELRVWNVEKLVDLVAGLDFERVKPLLLQRAQLSASDLRYPNGSSFLGARITPEDAAERLAKNEIGARFQQNYAGAPRVSRIGLDDRTRWTPYEITNVYAGHRQFWIHRCAVDLTTGDVLYEVVREIFHSDIVSLIRVSERQRRDLPLIAKKAHKASRFWSKHGGVITDETLHMDARQEVRLALTSGEVLEIALWHGERDGSRSKDIENNIASAQELQRWVHEAKQRPAPALRIPRVVRYPKQTQNG